MLTTVHGAFGFLIGEHTSSPLLAFVLGFLSHFILDIIPHGDHDDVENYVDHNKLKSIINVIVIDSIAGIIFLILIFTHLHNSTVDVTPIAAGIIGAILPDFLVAFYALNKRRFFRLNFLHHKIHQLIKFDLPFSMAFILQIILMVVLWQFYNF
jgi:uncharacterized membrane protein YeaQ/YmgE (transglycosylase-associated protein family)